MRPMDRRMESNGSSDGAGRHRALFRAKRKRASSRSRVTCTPFNNKRGTEWTSASSLFSLSLFLSSQPGMSSSFTGTTFRRLLDQCSAGRAAFIYLRLGRSSCFTTYYYVRMLLLTCSSSQSMISQGPAGGGSGNWRPAWSARPHGLA